MDTPELNPCEKIWQHIKSRFKNKTFDTMTILKEWLAESVLQMTEKQIMSITHNEKYLDNFNAAFSG
jgi:transposase